MVIETVEPTKRGVIGVLKPIAKAFVIIVIAGLAVIGVFGPPLNVVTGEELGKKYLDVLHAEGILDNGEQVVLFYSNALLFIRDDGNMLTDKRVISYEVIEDKLEVYEASFGEIESVVMVEKGGFLSDSLVEVTHRNGSSFLLYLSPENDGDVLFLNEVEKRISF